MSPEQKNDDQFIVFHINGSPEKDLIGTTVVNSIHQAEPEKKIIVTTNFPEVWLHNPDVFRVYKLGNIPYFYDDFIKNKNTKIYAHDPYLTDDFIYNKKPITEIWCEMIKIKYNNSLPKLYFTQREEEVAQRLMKTEKPILLIQGNELLPITSNFNWAKDLPIYVLQKISDTARERGFEVIQIRNQNQPAIIGASTLSLSLRLSFAAIKHIDKCLFIDSFMQHAAVAMNKPSVITWLSTSPDSRGYGIHKNILGEITESIKDRLDEYSPVFDVTGEHINRPVILEDVYSPDEIIKALDL